MDRKRVSFNKSKRSVQQDGDVTMGSASEPSASKKARSSANQRLGLSGPKSTEERRKPYASAARRPGNVSKRFNDAKTSGSSSSKGAIEILKEFLNRRYDHASNLLNLEDMAADEAFKGPKALLPPGQRSQSRTNASPALWKLVGEQFPQTISLSLANNKIKDLTDLVPAALIRALPNLQNLSLQSNLITDLKALNPLASDDAIGRVGLNCLNELVLFGNPVREAALSNGTLDAFIQEVATRFPTLTALDGTPLTPTQAPKPVASTSKTPLGSGLKQPAVFSVGMKPGMVDGETDLIQGFLAKYFQLFDENRSLLFPAYAPDAVFSLSVNSSIPFRAKAMKSVQDLPRQHKLNWHPYFEQSRNMLKTHKIDASQLQENIRKRLYTGPTAIVDSFSKIPKSKHPLTDAEKFVVDGWSLPSIPGDTTTRLVVSVHGQFVEEPSGGSRSFDRTFILTPPQATSSSPEWPCIIVSDQLTVRGFSEPKAWSEAALKVAPVAPTPSQTQPISSQGPALPIALDPSLPPAQQQILAELQSNTRLNAVFARQCLEEHGWDLPKALAGFQAVAAQVPPHAFLPA